MEPDDYVALFVYHLEGRTSHPQRVGLTDKHLAHEKCSWRKETLVSSQALVFAGKGSKVTVSRNEVLDTVLQVPLPQIENSLRNFPNAELEFEVRLTSTSPWSALSFCADALSQARLNLISLKYASDAGIMARLSHCPDSDLPSLHRALTYSTVVKLAGWTTILKPVKYHSNPECR